MDKYIVDLDKVLDDFEYSELTDNFGSSRAYLAQGGSNYASSSKSRTGDAKHSITNVFHSLNEYLNTEITSKSPKQVGGVNNFDNKEDNNKDNNKESQGNKGNKENEVQNSNFEVKTGNLLDLSISESFRTEYKEKSIDLEAICDKNESNYNDIIDLECKTNFSNDNKLCKETESNFEVMVDVKNEIFQVKNDVDNVGNDKINVVDDKINENVDKIIIEDENNLKIDNESQEIEHNLKINVKVDDLKEGIDDFEINDDVKVDFDQQGVDFKQEDVDSKQQNADLKENIEINEKSEINQEKVEKIIKFDDNLEIDDSLLNKYLDELEVEYDEEKETTANVETAKFNENDDLKVNDELKIEGNDEINDLCRIENDSKRIEEIIIDKSKEIKDKSKEIKDKSKEINDKSKETKDLSKEIKDFTKESKEIEDISKNIENVHNLKDESDFKSNFSKDNDSIMKQIMIENDLIENDAIKSDAIKNDAIKNDSIKNDSIKNDSIKNDLIKNDSIENDLNENIDSIERPNNLDLNRSSFSSDSDELKPRKIDLIGEPGSTPYNNVYVSKELTLDEVQEAIRKEKETSSSPTFSEASTDTVSDSNDTEVDELNLRCDAKDGADDDGSKNGYESCENCDVNEINETNKRRIELIGGVGRVNEEEGVVGDCSGGVEDGVKDLDEGKSGVEMVAESGEPKESGNVEENVPVYWLGKQAPLWIPDSDALSCLHCDTRFTVIKRRHHCRACGLVLCSKCCNLKFRLEYLDAEARVCLKCHNILSNLDYSSSSDVSPTTGNSPSRQPNPNNPMEYCSVVPPLQQAGSSATGTGNPPTVMVPVGVLKRKGSKKSNKSVMFCDGIRPGSDLTKLDGDFDSKLSSTVDNNNSTDNRMVKSREIPMVYPETLTFVPKDSKELPPLVSVCKSETSYFCNMYKNDGDLLKVLKEEKLTFALQKNVFVHVKIIDLNCCINKKVWCFSTEGFLSVGQDEIVYLIELNEQETCLPIDIFNHLNIIYNDALKGTTVGELGTSLHDSSSFMDFKNHAGFLYVRPTFQCTQNVIKPKEPFLVGLLIHRWETPWAKIFPLRLMLRLGAEYRYYPCPLISTRFRDSLFVELGHTVITLFADFRNFSYTLTSIRGLSIHMEGKNTIVRIPTNRYDQVMSSMNNSSDHILVFGGNFSTKADSHLVCIQDTQSSTENAYTTHTIDIKNQPRKIIGASFIVFNGALKSTSGLTAKSSIVEDGLMIQISAEDMISLRESLRNMKDFIIQCGCVNMPSDESVNIIWGDVDKDFNVGVVSPIDNQSLSGVPSIRVHNGKNFTGPGNTKMIRWTEVFILQNTDETSKTRDHPLDISKISDSIAKATCTALVKYLDLLCSNNFFKIGIRVNLHVENVSYSAGSNNVKLPPIYMKSLDNELIPVLHRILSNNLGEDVVTLELIFRILNS